MAAVSPWKLDSIAAGDKSFDSARLVYRNPAGNSPLRLEFLRIGTSIDLFLNLSQFTIAPSLLDPASASVRFAIEGEPPFEEPIPLLEGRMRLRFLPETASRVTRALQDGKKVGILVDGFEETIEPERFPKLYEKLAGGSTLLQNPFKGPME